MHWHFYYLCILRRIQPRHVEQHLSIVQIEQSIGTSMLSMLLCHSIHVNTCVVVITMVTEQFSANTCFLYIIICFVIFILSLKCIWFYISLFVYCLFLVCVFSLLNMRDRDWNRVKLVFWCFDKCVFAHTRRLWLYLVSI